jgi:hypothetical protein
VFTLVSRILSVLLTAYILQRGALRLDAAQIGLRSERAGVGSCADSVYAKKGERVRK